MLPIEQDCNYIAWQLNYVDAQTDLCANVN